MRGGKGWRGKRGGGLLHRRLAVVAAEKAFICDWCDGSNLDAVIGNWNCDGVCWNPNGANYCSGWDGITCSSESIVSIILEGSAIIGTLPPSIGCLTNLVTLGRSLSVLIASSAPSLTLSAVCPIRAGRQQLPW